MSDPLMNFYPRYIQLENELLSSMSNIILRTSRVLKHIQDIQTVLLRKQEGLSFALPEQGRHCVAACDGMQCHYMYLCATNSLRYRAQWVGCSHTCTNAFQLLPETQE